MDPLPHRNGGGAPSHMTLLAVAGRHDEAHHRRGTDTVIRLPEALPVTGAHWPGAWSIQKNVGSERMRGRPGKSAGATRGIGVGSCRCTFTHAPGSKSAAVIAGAAGSGDSIHR